MIAVGEISTVLLSANGTEIDASVTVGTTLDRKRLLISVGAIPVWLKKGTGAQTAVAGGAGCFMVAPNSNLVMEMGLSNTLAIIGKATGADCSISEVV